MCVFSLSKSFPNKLREKCIETQPSETKAERIELSLGNASQFKEIKKCFVFYPSGSFKVKMTLYNFCF